MRLIFYIFFISQFLIFLGVFAEKVKEDSSGLNSINWEKVEGSKSKRLNKIIWKSYKNDEFYFGNKQQQKGSITNRTNSSSGKKIFESTKKSVFFITEIEPFYLSIIFLKKVIFKLQLVGNHLFKEGQLADLGNKSLHLFLIMGFQILP